EAARTDVGDQEMENDTRPSSDRNPPHRNWHGTHQSFAYRPQAFRWTGHELVGINLVSLATSMHASLTRRGHLPIATLADLRSEGGYTNPYTYSGGALGLILSRVVNAAYDFGVDTSDEDPVDAEIEQLRLFNEIVLYSARFCEAAVKQLLHCTNV